MKQFLFLCLLTVASAVGGLVSPFWAVLGYYTLAVLRPQYLWDWALPMEVRWSLIAALMTLLAVFLHGQRLFKRGRFNSTTGLMLVYAVLVLASLITAYDPHVAQVWATDFAKVMLIALIATFVIEHLWQVRYTAIMIGLCLGYIAYEINFYYFMQHARLDVFHYGFGGLDNNGAGLMLAMGLPFAYCFAISGNMRTRVVALIVGVLLTHSIMLTYSRGAMLAAAVGAGWLAWHHRPRWQMVAVAPIVIVATLALAGPEVRDEFISISDYRQDRSAMSRFDSWSAAWEIAWDHPIFGAGMRNSNQYSHNYGADRVGRTIHNQYLQVAADSGIPTALVYIVLVFTTRWRLGVARHRVLRRSRQLKDDDEQPQTVGELIEAGNLCLAMQASLAIFAMGAMFLSLETFELPWLIIVVSGVLPAIVKRRLQALDDSASDTANEDGAKRPRFVFAPPVPRTLAPEPSP